MQHIMSMTVAQFLAAIPHHAMWILVALSAVLNFEAIVRQVAVNKGYKNVVSWCDRIAGVITFIIDVATAVARKPIQENKAYTYLDLCIFIIGCALVVGCISAGVQGTGIDVHDPTHGIEVQANSINAQGSINAAH